jgi:hypothetical protein
LTANFKNFLILSISGYGINECGEPISSSSHFRIASISKVFTAIAVLRLCEEGLINLGKKVFGETGMVIKVIHQNL